MNTNHHGTALHGASSPNAHNILACGDVHGHFLLALTVAAEWQKRGGFKWDAILLAGDLGLFFDENAIDKATRRMAESNPCELEFPRLWLREPTSRLIDEIFNASGLGLDCPIIGVHGNHEDFARLSQLVPENFNDAIVSPSDLPTVEPTKKIRLIPNGWIVRLQSGVTITGFGGIESRKKENAHPMTFIDEAAVEKFLESGLRTNILLTHEGPSSALKEGGSQLVQKMAMERVDDFVIHGHHVEQSPFPIDPKTGKPLVIGLEGIAFHGKSTAPGQGWARIVFDSERQTFSVKNSVPDFVTYEFSRGRWLMTEDGVLIPPPLQEAAWNAGIRLQSPA